MEIVFSFFNLICSLIVDMLYEKKFTNNLFSFDIPKRLILIKKGKNSSFTINKAVNIDKKLEEKNPSELNNFLFDKKKRKRGVVVIKTKNKDINSKNDKYDFAVKNTVLEMSSVKKDSKTEKINLHSIKNSSHDINKNDPISFVSLTKESKKIALKDILCSLRCFCGGQKRNIYNVLLNESMNFVSEKLDIFNIFRNIYSIEYSNNDLKSNTNSFKMSEECLNDLSEIIK